MSTDPKATYYDAGGIETIAVIRAKLTPEQFLGYCIGNVIKYLCRINHKGQPVRDAEKVAQYSEWIRETMEAHPELAESPGASPTNEKWALSEVLLTIQKDVEEALASENVVLKNQVLSGIVEMSRSMMEDRPEPTPDTTELNDLLAILAKTTVIGYSIDDDRMTVTFAYEELLWRTLQRWGRNPESLISQIPWTLLDSHRAR
jgi:hypothetical protein